MHHTTDVVPNFTEKNKYSWQKKHSENKTGTSESFKPTKIKKNSIKKNMKLGFKIYIYLILFLFFNFSILAQDKITSSPLLNLEEIKPSFDEQDDNKENVTTNKSLKKKKQITKDTQLSHAVLIGLDKITAKSSKITIYFNKAKKFGPLEIKILKCGKVNVNNNLSDVAYMQVKDLTKTENEKVFIFNGWTFSSDPSLTPFDHAIYDLQLLNCFNV